jgi:hypothetical protein
MKWLVFCFTSCVQHMIIHKEWVNALKEFAERETTFPYKVLWGRTGTFLKEDSSRSSCASSRQGMKVQNIWEVVWELQYDIALWDNKKSHGSLCLFIPQDILPSFQTPCKHMHLAKEMQMRFFICTLFACERKLKTLWFRLKNSLFWNEWAKREAHFQPQNCNSIGTSYMSELWQRSSCLDFLVRDTEDRLCWFLGSEMRHQLK